MIQASRIGWIEWSNDPAWSLGFSFLFRFFVARHKSPAGKAPIPHHGGIIRASPIHQNAALIRGGVHPKSGKNPVNALDENPVNT
jgi:hypothetical protein